MAVRYGIAVEMNKVKKGDNHAEIREGRSHCAVFDAGQTQSYGKCRTVVRTEHCMINGDSHAEITERQSNCAMYHGGRIQSTYQSNLQSNILSLIYSW
jgi:hypothetical protein